MAAPSVLPYTHHHLFINLKNRTVMAVNQKAIGCKLDIEILDKLEQYCASKNLKKNNVINLAVEYYIDHGITYP